MVHVKDAYLDTHDFDSFGPTHVCMNMESSYELLYRLAAFLANTERKQASTKPKSSKKKLKSNQYSQFLTAFKKAKRLDA